MPYTATASPATGMMHPPHHHHSSHHHHASANAWRLEEKKSGDSIAAHKEQGDARSSASYKSTPSTRSSVLERAREYNRRIDAQNRRTQSLERSAASEHSSSAGSASPNGSKAGTPRSRSVGRTGSSSSRVSTRERAMASVRKDSHSGNNTSSNNHSSMTLPHANTSSSTPRSQPHSQASANQRQQPREGSPNTSQQQQPPYPNHPQQQQPPPQQQQHLMQPTLAAAGQGAADSRRVSAGDASHQTRNTNHRSSTATKDSPGRSLKSASQKDEVVQEAVVSPELLVDALSGHEDGLLAIAEKLMEHYDAGYDAMGEAIIDAFADVQKLFQHVVEAAHMEGAAFEASRREDEMADLRKRLAQQGGGDLLDDHVEDDNAAGRTSPNDGAPTRHDEFIDQDVKDVLTDAIRKGTTLRDTNKHEECYRLFEHACQSASSLLPVDSDHRGRLQLSIARAESMSHDRACAILRYAMDDVLRSGQRAVKTVLPDESQRQDVVLNRPTAASAAHHIVGVVNGVGTGAAQSADEALASLQEELKEILGAPVYKDTPLQAVAKRFWAALAEAQKSQQKNEERLEQNLGKLKGEFLLARAEWEEKLNKSNEMMETYKEKYSKLKESSKGDKYMEQARAFANRLNQDGKYPDDVTESNHSHQAGTSVRSAGMTPNRAGSVASLGSGLAQHAKTLVNTMNNFNCAALNERSGPQVQSELQHEEPPIQLGVGIHKSPGASSRATSTNNSTSIRSNGGSVMQPPPHHNNGSNHYQYPNATPRDRSRSRQKSSKSFREYSKSPKRVDV